MPDRIQTLSVAGLTRAEIKALIEVGGAFIPGSGNSRRLAFTGEIETAVSKLRSLLSQSEHQGDEGEAERIVQAGLVGQKPCPDCNPAPTQVEGVAVAALRAAQAEAELWAERHWDAVVYLAQTEGEWEWIPDKVEVFDIAERAYRDAEEEVKVLRRAAELLAAAPYKPEQPEGGDEEDWPPVVLNGFEAQEHRDNDGTMPSELMGKARRYVPATSQDSAPKHPGGAAGEGEDDVEAIHRIAIEKELDRLDQATLAEWAELLLGLGAEGWQLVHAVSRDSSGLGKQLQEAVDRGRESEHAADRLEREQRSLFGELARLLGPQKPREDVTANDQWISAVARTLTRAERAETALEELAQEFTDRSRVRPGETDESMGEKIAYEEAASLAREKAAELKGEDRQ
jgi:hypothetical protein